MDLRLLLPDLALLVLIGGLLFVRRQTGLVAAYALVAIAGMQLGSYLSGAGTGTVLDVLRLDGFAVFGRTVLLLGAAAVVTLYQDELPEGIKGGRSLALMLLSLSGAMLLPAATDLLMLYAGLELMALPACLWLMAPTARSAEGGIKTFFFGAALSATFLFGATLLYGLGGTTDLGAISRELAQLGTTTNGPMLLGALLVTAGLAGKMALVPFHAPYPDTLEASGTQQAYWLTVPLFAGAVALMRVLHDALPAARDLWAPFLVVVCVLTLVIGPLLALAQTQLKRLLAFAAMTQVGFWSLGLLAIAHPDTSSDAMAAVLFAAIATGLALLALVAAFQAVGAERLTDLAGLFGRSPWLAAVLLVACLGLAGLPPVAGFWSKILLFKGVVAYANAAMAYGLVWLVALAAVSAVVLGYALLRPVRLAFFEGAPIAEPVTVRPHLLAVAAVGAVGSLLLFLMPHALWQPLLAAVAGL